MPITQGWSRLFARLILLFLLITLLPLSPPANAEDDEADEGFSADTLTIKVGYAGGPYYEKHTFTLEELESLDVTRQAYTYIDNMPSVVIEHVEGVRLSDVMAAAGIDLGSIRTFHFYTNDKATGGSYRSLSKTSLIDQQRFVYYSLPENFTEDGIVDMAAAGAQYERVETMLALRDNWLRPGQGGTFNFDYSEMNTKTRFRLVFGQATVSEQRAEDSAKWISTIEVELGGTPTVSVTADVLDLEVGSEFRATASIRELDSAIQTDWSQVQWSSSDESVATVDSEGNVTVLAEGSFTITASYRGGTASAGFSASNPDDPEDPEDEQPEEQEEPPDAVIQVEDGPNSNDGDNSGSGGGVSAGTNTNRSSTNGANNATPTDDADEYSDGEDDDEAAPLEAPDNAVEVELDTPSPTDQMMAYHILDSLSPTESQEGGVQNWRLEEMSETATELGEIEDENPLLGVTAVASVGLLLAGAAARAIKYILDVGGSYVFIRKP